MGGCESSMFCHRKDKRRVKRPKHEFLTDEERVSVAVTWKKLISIRDPQKVGEKIFLRIFHINPDTKNAFHAFKNLNREELMRSSLFKSHAIRFMLAIEVTMKNLDALDVVVQPTLHHLGTRHVNFVGFRPEYLETFERAMEDIWSEELGWWRFNKVNRKAWKKIFRMVTTSVHGGFEEGLAEKRRQENFEMQRRSISNGDVCEN